MNDPVSVASPRSARLAALYVGLALFGLSIALLVRARLGLDPWDVLHQGIARRLGVSIGAVVVGVALVVLLAWIPLRQRPGLGTVSNALLVGVFADLGLDLIGPVHALSARIVLLVAAIAVNALATGLYIGAGFGPGPRDGLMTGLAARGWSLRGARLSIELGVLAAGWLLGGDVGPGTVCYALSIGPLVAIVLPITAGRLGTELPSRAREAVEQ